MLIRPTDLTLVEIFFCIVPMVSRLIRLISIKMKEYKFDRHCEKGLWRKSRVAYLERFKYEQMPLKFV